MSWRLSLESSRVATGDAEQAIQERRGVWNRDSGWKDAVLAPFVGMRADLVPHALHQVSGKCWIHADHSGDVVRAQATEAVDLPQVFASGEVANIARP
jgi:hypothetical protein